ncbi:MAG: YMGG-like glycine zipper-containing protein [Thermodesulfobacteriota bacterium]
MKKMLKLGPPLLGLVLTLSLFMGCATPQNPYTYQGAGLGAAVGAAIGAGANGKNPWKGAGIGALVGGATGAIAGEMYGRSNPYCPPDCPPQQYGYGYNQPYQGGYYNQPARPQPHYGAYQARNPYYEYGY